MKLIALLRGINVSGKNKIEMKALKAGFEELGFSSVATVLNSGNVVFETAENISTSAITDNVKTDTLINTVDDNTKARTSVNTADIAEKISSMILLKFNLSVPVLVISADELTDILNHSPLWWGTENKETYDDLIFIFPQYTFAEVKTELGDIKPEIEQIENYKNVIFWSFDLKNYRKSLWYAQSALPPVKDKITVRTAGTVRKLLAKK